MAAALYVATSLASPLLEACNGDYRLVAAASAAFWLTLKAQLGCKGGVEWFSLGHATLAGAGGVLVAYLDAHAVAIDPGGVPEPLRSVRCAGALTPLHAVLPMITLGYAAADLADGLRLGRKDFILHGLALGSCFGLVCHLGVPHLVASALVMDVSSVPLNVLHLKWRSSTADVACHVVFMLAFFATRIVAFPYIWGNWVWAYYDDIIVGGRHSCYPPFFIYAVLGFGLLFHCLNAYWMIFIAKKALRKVSGGVAARHGEPPITNDAKKGR